ncbi:MAG: hypothetical protein KDC98_05880 [Planctomycetes bacterium]|nr:hypothetical protein [Planctomycetota bacterium]
MQRTTSVLFFALTLLAALPAQRDGRGGGRGPREFLSPKLENFTFANGTFASKKMQSGEAAYYILLPKGHDAEADKDKKYPWILWLPGFGGANDVLGRGGAEVLDKLRGEGKIPDMALVVFRASTGRRGRTTYMNGEGIGDVEDCIVTDLLTELPKQHPLSDKREQRALMGVSAGGFGALKIALRHPELFGAVAVHSAAILPADPADLEGMAESMVMRYLHGGIAEQLGDPIDKAKWQAIMPLGIVATKKPEELKGLQIYFDAGTDDHYGFFEPNQELSKVMKANGHKHLFREVEEGGHAWSSPKMKGNVEASLTFVAAALSGKDAVEEANKAADTKATDAGKQGK